MGPDCSRRNPAQFWRPSYPSMLQTAAGAEPASRQLKVCIVTAEVVGPVTNGGIGTALTALAHTLVSGGHHVTMLFTMGAVAMTRTFDEWAAEFRQQGVQLLALGWPPRQAHVPHHLLLSYQVYLFLSSQQYDVVHFHDYQGAGYYSLLAKSQGAALVNTTTVVGMHGPTLWAKVVGNGEAVRAVADLEQDWMERRSVGLADWVVSPSAYLLAWAAGEGWPLGRHCLVQPNLLPPGLLAAGAPAGQRPLHDITELVFFGRLEARKGVITFCDAIDQLLTSPQAAAARARLRKVTFLGRGAFVRGEWGPYYVAARAANWSVAWELVGEAGPREAQAFLAQPGRLAVVPSAAENSPYAVYECAHLGLPFLAAAVGGVPDLLAQEDRQHALFEPTSKALVQRLVAALTQGVRAARPSIDAAANAREWLAWHLRIAQQAEQQRGQPAPPPWPAWAAAFIGRPAPAEAPVVSVVIVHFNNMALCRQALASVEEQTYPQQRLEVILLDNGSAFHRDRLSDFLSWAQQRLAARQLPGRLLRRSHTSLGAARNAGANAASSEYLFFLDDTAVAKPHAIAAFTAAAEQSGADMLSSFVEFIWDDQPPPSRCGMPSWNCTVVPYLFLGGSAQVAAFKNCIGGPSVFVRRDTLQAVGRSRAASPGSGGLGAARAARPPLEAPPPGGGFASEYAVGWEEWELGARLAAAGRRVEVVPAALVYHRFRASQPRQEVVDLAASRRRALAPLLPLLPGHLQEPLEAAVMPGTVAGVTYEEQRLGGWLPRQAADSQASQCPAPGWAAPASSLAAQGLTRWPGVTDEHGAPLADVVAAAAACQQELKC